MLSHLKRLLGISSYQSLNSIELSLKNLINNYKYLQSINRKVRIAPVLKSNAYGHGIVMIAKILEGCSDCHVPFFCMDSIYEAYELYKARIKTPILIMGYIQPENLKVKKLPFSYAVSTLDLAQAISKYQPQAGVHLFVDTGIHREGIPLDELPQFLERLPNNLNIEGVMSHLASADDKKDPLNKIQFKNFKKTLEICQKHRIHPKWIHIQNSDGIINQIGEGNLARVGLALYGINSVTLSEAKGIETEELYSSAAPQNDKRLNPILTLKSKIIQIKKLKIGDRVGYSGTFTAMGPMTLGVLPLGYYDGVDRRLSNLGFVTVGRTPCKIIGRVSMNITTIDLSHIKSPQIGQEVIIYSSSPTDPNSISNAAKLCKTIPYDLLVHLASSTKRMFV